jgi:hypothetical protein
MISPPGSKTGGWTSIACAPSTTARTGPAHPAKGVGRFTAGAGLMLALRRPDVWPAADLALPRGRAEVADTRRAYPSSSVES